MNGKTNTIKRMKINIFAAVDKLSTLKVLPFKILKDFEQCEQLYSLLSVYRSFAEHRA